MKYGYAPDTRLCILVKKRGALFGGNMERLSTCDLRDKEVVNVCDGTRLGCPIDFEFDCKDGRITAIIVPRPSGFLGICRDKDIIIPWCKIECIGSDTILVRLAPEEYCLCDKEKRKKSFRDFVNKL